MPSPAERRAAVEPIIRRYSAACPGIATATNVTQALDAIVRQRIYDSGGRLDYRVALDQVFAADAALKQAYAND
jgi:hypothetical protein